MTKTTPAKFQVVNDKLRSRILAGEWPLMSKLPSEVELSKRLSCSAGTVHKALSLLAQEGFVERRRRGGTTVVRNKIIKPAVSVALDAFAFIFLGEQHEGNWRTFRGFQQASMERKRRIMMLSVGSDYRRETEILSRLAEFDVQGAVLFPAVPTVEAQAEFSLMVKASKYPIVLAEVSLPCLGCSSVVVDGFHAGYTMTRHLIDMGAQQIGFFSNYASVTFMRDRYQGYRWAMDEAGIPENSKNILLEPFMHLDLENPLAESTELAKEYLKTCGKLDAVVCGNDFLAVGLSEAARERGIRIPEDLKIVGIDDYSISAANFVPLTTYRIPYEEMGCLAYQHLERIVSGSGSDCSETQIRGELVKREST